MTHNKPETFPYLAKPILFCSKVDFIKVIEAIVKIQKDFGDRTNRKHARLKYLIAEKGINWFKEKIEAFLLLYWNKYFENKNEMEIINIVTISNRIIKFH